MRAKVVGGALVLLTLAGAIAAMKSIQSRRVRMDMSRSVPVPAISPNRKLSRTRTTQPRDAELIMIPAGTVQIGDNAGPPHNMLAWRRLPLFSIREGDWKLWESVEDKTGKYGEYKLLFNLKDDPNEATNLAGRNPRKVRELEQIVHQWAKTMLDPKWPSRPPATFDVCGTPFTLPI